MEIKYFAHSITLFVIYKAKTAISNLEQPEKRLADRTAMPFKGTSKSNGIIFDPKGFNKQGLVAVGTNVELPIRQTFAINKVL